MSDGLACKSCGHPNTPDAMFCSKCGSKMAPQTSEAREDVPERAVAASGEAPRSAAAATSEPAPPRDPAPPRGTPRRRVAGSSKTMIGLGGADEAMIAAAKAATAARRAVDSSPLAAEASATPASAPRRRNLPGQGRTMLGMPAPDRAKVEAAIEQARSRQDAEAGRDAPAPRPEAALGAMSNRTMLGRPAPRVEGVDAGPREAGSAEETQAPQGLQDASSSGRMRAPVVYPSDTGEEDALTLPTRRPGRVLALATLVLGVIVLAVGSGALAWALFAGGPGLQASVIQGENGEMLEIEVPGAADGTRVRFGGQEEALEAGRARFPLSADDLRLGDNELSVDVVSPSGEVETEAVQLHLEMRVRADLGPLEQTPPAIEVVVEAPAGSEVTLDGEALELDARGHGTRRYEIDAGDVSAQGMVEQVVRYRVRPAGGEEAQGELRTLVPVTSLQLDRPGTSVVTDQTSVEFAGAVAPSSTVTVDGQAVQVREGRFVHRLELAETGERTVEVVAHVRGRAPRVARVQIRRVDDLEAEAASFEHNAELTYAHIQQNPATYRGQRVRFEGLVYNVDVRNGGSIVQVLVSRCPAGAQCPLWVTFPAATDVERRSVVRVFGTVAGEQQFRSQSGEIRTVPRVDATFILPSEAPR